MCRPVIHLSCLLLLNNVTVAPWRCLSLHCQVIGCRTLIVWWLRKASRQDLGGHMCDTSLLLVIIWQDEPSKRSAGMHRMDQCVLNWVFWNLFIGSKSPLFLFSRNKDGKVRKSNTLNWIRRRFLPNNLSGAHYVVLIWTWWNWSVVQNPCNHLRSTYSLLWQLFLCFPQGQGYYSWGCHNIRFFTILCSWPK